MSVLTSRERKLLEGVCVRGRRAAEHAVRAALIALALTAERPPAHLSEEDRRLRRGLRAKARQLGDQGDSLALLVAECAYEQWHRLLFARFLAENDLLLHPEYRAPVTIEDCEELAASLGEPDGWSVAARFAADILPGIFRLADPCVSLHLAPEGRLALEGILAELPAELLTADDALGWVYQFWQKDKKDEVNASERKIGGADIGPVTQLFTEHYMVRFLFENSLAAWWAARHPDSPLVKTFEYLRLDDDGKPAAGSFDSWPERVSEVTVMDPCCGSGHFLVEAFSMLWQMRVEEEGLSPVDAQDAVLRENLFGLELDPRCVQIAMFAVALQAWKAGGGWRELPVPNIACSGIPVKASVEEWTALALGDACLESALTRLHILFRDADTLGSLIDPIRDIMRADDSNQAALDEIEWSAATEIIHQLVPTTEGNSERNELAVDVSVASRAATSLARSYTLVATNVPFLSRGKQVATLQRHLDRYFADARADLATAMLRRWLRTSDVAVVTPQHWHSKLTYQRLRKWVLSEREYPLFARIGNNVWQTQSGGQPFKVPTVLSIFVGRPPEESSTVVAIDIGDGPTALKGAELQRVNFTRTLQRKQLENTEHRIVTRLFDDRLPLLSDFADCYQGTSTGDNVRYCLNFWELDDIADPWRYWQSSVVSHTEFGGREHVVRWNGQEGAERHGAAIRGRAAWGRRGMAISQMGRLYTTQYTGELYDNNVAALIPKRVADLSAVHAFMTSAEFVEAVRVIDQSVKVEVATLPKVPFDFDRWRKVADETVALPEPFSDDPTQWLFAGRPEVSAAPLQVAVPILLGYRWPERADSDDLDVYADADGIVCLPPVAGEAPGVDRLQQLLATAYGASWSPSKATELLAATGSKKNLGDWLRDEFFKQHCALFGNRPFVWHIWDGLRDGFSALVNYHRLDRKTLEKLTYTYLGDWIERQRADLRDGAAGAETKLAAAQKLRESLELILAGEPPYDIFVRWKPLAKQPIGWDPNINDGVRLNIRPFIQAGILRSPVNVNWKKDRGANPDGSERLNDLHFTSAEKRAARGESA